MDRGDWQVTIHRVIKSWTQVTHHSTQLMIITHTLTNKKERFNDIYSVMVCCWHIMNYHKPSSFKQCPCINLLLFMFCSVHVHVLFMFWAWQSWDLCSDPIQLTQGVGHCCDLLRSRDSPQFTAVIDKIQFFMVIRLRLQFSLQHQILL